VIGVGHRVVASSGAGPSGFVDGHTLSQMMTIMGDRAVRMFLPFFETDAADDTPVQDVGPRGHHFLKYNTSDQPPYIKGHVLAYRLNGGDEAFDMADHDDFSMGADGTPANEPAFTIGIAVKFKSIVGTYNLITRFDQSGVEEVEYRFFFDSGRPFFSIYDAVQAVFIGRRRNAAYAPDEWLIIFVTYDGSCANTGVRIYVNGVRVDDNNNSAGGYVAMHNEAASTVVGYHTNAAGNPVNFLWGDCWGPFITKKCLSGTAPAPGAQSEVVRLTNLYRRVLCL